MSEISKKLIYTNISINKKFKEDKINYVTISKNTQKILNDTNFSNKKFALENIVSHIFVKGVNSTDGKDILYKIINYLKPKNSSVTTLQTSHNDLLEFIINKAKLYNNITILNKINTDFNSIATIKKTTENIIKEKTLEQKPKNIKSNLETKNVQINKLSINGINNKKSKQNGLKANKSSSLLSSFFGSKSQGLSSSSSPKPQELSSSPSSKSQGSSSFLGKSQGLSSFLGRSKQSTNKSLVKTGSMTNKLKSGLGSASSSVSSSFKSFFGKKNNKGNIPSQKKVSVSNKLKSGLSSTSSSLFGKSQGLKNGLSSASTSASTSVSSSFKSFFGKKNNKGNIPSQKKVSVSNKLKSGLSSASSSFKSLFDKKEKKSINNSKKEVNAITDNTLKNKINQDNNKNKTFSNIYDKYKNSFKDLNMKEKIKIIGILQDKLTTYSNSPKADKLQIQIMKSRFNLLANDDYYKNLIGFGRESQKLYEEYKKKIKNSNKTNLQKIKNNINLNQNKMYEEKKVELIKKINKKSSKKEEEVNNSNPSKKEEKINISNPSKKEEVLTKSLKDKKPKSYYNNQIKKISKPSESALRNKLRNEMKNDGYTNNEVIEVLKNLAPSSERRIVRQKYFDRIDKLVKNIQNIELLSKRQSLKNELVGIKIDPKNNEILKQYNKNKINSIIKQRKTQLQIR